MSLRAPASALRRAALVPLALLLPALLVACGGDGATSVEAQAAKAAARTGTLTVAISGVEAGSVLVTGPAGYSRQVTSTETLGDLRKGTYTATASPVTAGGVTYSPSPASRTVSVNGGTYTAAFTYAAAAATTGSLTVTIDGLPSGTAAVATVAGPNGYDQAVGATTTLAGLAAGSYTVTAAPVAAGASTYEPSPATQPVSVTAGATAGATITYAAGSTTPTGLDLRIDGMYLTQSVQTFTGAVPLVANRAGVLRVFAVASEANTLKPSVRVRLFVNGAPTQTYTATAGAASVPTQVAEGTYAASWNVAIPAAEIRPGLAILADVDPTGAVAEADETNNSWPRAGTAQALDVRVVPTFGVRFVPIVQSGTGVAGSVGDVATLLKSTRAMHPIADVTTETRATYTTSRSLASGGTGWSEVLSELYSLRVADGSPRDYYGLVRVSYTSGVAGIGYVGAPVSMGWDWSGSASGIMAHEVGHTWGRRHAPCGGVSGADTSYPYAGGVIGAWGLDVATGTLKSPTTQYDLMGYCNPSWISDYTYRGVLDFRGSSRTALAAAGFEEEGASVAQPALLVWGRVTAGGEVVIEPAFRLVTAPAMPRSGGRHTLEGRDANGVRLFAVSFDGDEIADGPAEGDRHFAFAVPMDEATQARLATLELTGRGAAGRTEAGRRAAEARRAGLPAPAAEAVAEAAGNGRVRLRWDADAFPMALVRDPVTGEVLSFARDGAAEIVSARGELEIVLSDRVQSVGQRVRVRGR